MQTPIYPMTHVAPTVAALLGIPAPTHSTGAPLAEVIADLSGCPRCAVVVPDALGMHPWGLWRDEMPYLSSLIDRRHVILRAMMVTKTPVNFATMVTGAEPAVHGINVKEDDFCCETLFEVLAANGKSGAACGQDGCTMGDLISRWAQIVQKAPRRDDQRVVELFIEIINTKTPDFIITQLVDTDDIFHQCKPSSPEVVPVLRETDKRLKRLVEALTARDYGVMILATHGSDCDADSLVPCTWVK